jgi:hypothetical protein
VLCFVLLQLPDVDDVVDDTMDRENSRRARGSLLRRHW